MEVVQLAHLPDLGLNHGVRLAVDLGLALGAVALGDLRQRPGWGGGGINKRKKKKKKKKK
jgi:hypothetical protein